MSLKKTFLLPFFCAVIILLSCDNNRTSSTAISPGRINRVQFFLYPDGSPGFKVKHNGVTVVDSSSISFDLQGESPLKSGFFIKSVTKTENDETWEMPWGEQRFVRNNYNEMTVHLSEEGGDKRDFKIIFRAYDDGVAFRYEFPRNRADSLIIIEEATSWKMTGDNTCWWIPGDYDSEEHLYSKTPLSKIDAIEQGKKAVSLAYTVIPKNAVHTPLTMKTKEGLFLSLHEASLIDYPATTLKPDSANFTLTSELVGSDRYGYKAKVALPFKTPWRTLIIADKAKELISSRLTENLCEPSVIEDISWFRPMKYTGIWWEMHIDKSTWAYEGGKHGATTENAKKYIDFAAQNGLGGVLIEGWNRGWECWFGFEDREGVFDFVTPYPDYNLDEVSAYAKLKGVSLIMHHETSAAVTTYEKQLDTAFSLMKKHGIDMVKTGYVGRIIPKGEHHHGQWMVNHYMRVVKEAAARGIAVNVHEPVKATGLRRTYPNLISQEGVRGQEFNAWSLDGGNPPEHIPIIAFTRMLAGPVDFTPGVFDIDISYKPNNRVNTTLAQQLAHYVILYSPIQMACDLPEHYKGNPAFNFIKEVGVNWERTVVIDGEIGEYIVIARQERETEDWFIGAATNQTSRSFTLDTDFLDKGVTYKATIYKDGESAHYRDNPKEISIVEMEVKRGDKITFSAAEGGGAAISLHKKKMESEIRRTANSAMVPNLDIAVRNGTKKEVITSSFLSSKTSEPAVFQAASLSKPLFAYIIMKMYQRGEIDLDKPLTHYITASRLVNREWAEKITARMVLSHTTGLPNWAVSPSSQEWPHSKLDFKFKPGVTFSYSGEGFYLLQQAVENILSNSLEQIAIREVFQTIGMHNSSYIWKSAYDTFAVNGFDKQGKSRGKGNFPIANSAYTLRTTASDYSLFLNELFYGESINEETRKEFLKPHINAIRFSDKPRDCDSKIFWALGVGVEKNPELGDIFFHWGDNGNFKALFAVVPSQQRDFVYFTNSARGHDIINAIAKTALGNKEDLALSDWINIIP